MVQTKSKNRTFDRTRLSHTVHFSIVFVVLATLIMFQNNSETYQNGGALQDDINALEDIVSQLKNVESKILKSLSLNNDKTILSTISTDISNIISNLTKSMTEVKEYLTKGLTFK